MCDGELVRDVEPKRLALVSLKGKDGAHTAEHTDLALQWAAAGQCVRNV
jgi:hypothetical protein